MKLSLAQIEKFLLENGWSTWYNKNYWVHPKTVKDPAEQDYTDYGLTAYEAYEFETKDCPPFEPVGPVIKAISALYGEKHGSRRKNEAGYQRAY